MNSALVLLSAAAVAASSPEVGLRRFGLFIGSNEGGPGRATLRYAGSDARATAQVLEQLGGIASADRSLLLSPDAAKIHSELERLKGLVAAARGAGVRTELVLYYSGHADEDGLLLGKERIGYRELREALSAVPADVRVAIVDSCNAGALIRLKGGKKVPAFLMDDSTVVRGQAFLTAASAEEAAQESDRIKGSYFTAALLTGLRGAADATRDGRVTLTEAYHYAFQETLARTERTSAGPQHPAYDIQLAGTGDLVMTDLRATSAGVVFLAELDGRLFLRDASGGLVAELRKNPGQPIELGVEPGQYSVTLDRSGATMQTSVTVEKGSHVELGLSRFSPASVEAVAKRGSDEKARRHTPVNISLYPSPVPVEELPVSNLSINLGGGRIRALHGVEGGVGPNLVVEEMSGLQGSASVNSVGGDVVGIQGAAGLNRAGARVRGIQAAAGLNVVQGELRGVQAAAGVNWAASSVTGVQAAAGFNYVGESITGVQAVAGLNVVSGEVSGVQAAGGVNVAPVSHGVQAAPVNLAGASEFQVGVFNASRERALVQAGVINYAREGAASVGVINLSPRSKPFSAGVLNYAKEGRVAIGVVNVGEDCDAPIGILNFYKNGYHPIAVWAGDVAAANVGVKLGGRHVYSLLGAGLTPGEEPLRWIATAGLGYHLPLDRWFVDVDLSASSLHRGSETRKAVLSTLRLTLGRQVFEHLAVVGGLTFNQVSSWGGEDADVALLPGWKRGDGDRTQRYFPGFMLGLQM